jgi:signal transduction histidine kinase
LLVGLRNVTDADSLESARLRGEPLRDVASTVLDDIKRLARGLRPSVLDDLGLAPAIERLVQDFGRTHGLDVSLEIHGLNGSRLPEQHAVTVYRIVQESLTNIAQQAQATTVDVAIERLGDELKITIQDDGRGFVVASAKQLISEGHLGLTGMQERAVLLGGWLTIQSQPGQGTQTVSGLPLPKGTG